MKSIDPGPDWLSCFAAGNQEAFTSLLEKHYTFTLLRARKYIRKKKTAEKLTFYAFLSAWRHRETFSSTGQVIDFIFREQREACMLHLAYYGEQSDLPPTPTDFHEIEPFVREVEKGPPSSERIRLEDLRTMLQRLDELPGHHQKILHERYAEGKTLLQIALEEDISAKAAGARRYRATRYMLRLFSFLWTYCPWLILMYPFFISRHRC